MRVSMVDDSEPEKHFSIPTEGAFEVARAHVEEPLVASFLQRTATEYRAAGD